MLSSVAWINASGGDWDTPSNWSTGLLPGPSDDVIISQTGITVTHAGDDSVQSISSQGTIELNGGSLTITAPSTINSDLTITGGILNVDGPLAVAGSFTLGSGLMLGGTGSIDAEGPATLAGSNRITGTTLNLHGVTTWDITAPNQFLGGGSQVNILPTATVAMVGAGSYLADLDNTPVAINNQGTVTASGAGARIQVPFNNSGTVVVLQGSLSLGVSDTASVSTGTFTGAAGTTIGLIGHDLTSSSVVSSDGQVELFGSDAGSFRAAGGTIAVAASFTGSVEDLGSSLLIEDAVNFTPAVGGPVTLTTGAVTFDFEPRLSGTDSLVANGPIVLDPGAVLDLTGTVDAYGGLTIDAGSLIGTTLNNHGTAVLDTTAGPYVDLHQGATINNLPGASFAISGPGGRIRNADGSAVTINNAGSFIGSITGGIFVVDAPVSNTGSLVAQQGELELSITNSGTVTVAAAATLDCGNYVQTSGTTTIQGGIVNGASWTIDEGTLVGSGTINADVFNGGQVIPGVTGAAGTLIINGNYAQTATGALDIDIGGRTVDSQYDQLAVLGAAMLGGTIDVALMNGFEPSLGNSFQPLTFVSSSGDFDFYNGIVLGNRLILDPALNPINLTFTVEEAVTAVALAAPASPSVSGQSVTFTADVTVALPPTTIDPVPTGTVTFYADGAPIGTGTLAVVDGQDQASLTIATLSTASHPITAAYTSGDDNFIPSPASAAQTQVVNQASTSTTVASSAAPAVFGQPVTFTATVSVVNPGSTAVADPSGTVTFYDNDTTIGTGTLSVVNGHDQATLTISSLSVGTHPISAAYTNGDGNFLASPASSTISEVINKDGTTTAAAASPGFASLGQTVTLSATVTANAPGSGTPNGSVDFYDTTTGTDLGSVAATSGVAALSTSSLPFGTQTITVSYGGDANFLTSSTTISVSVLPSIFVLNATASGALTLSGNASINIPGPVVVDSGSASAVSTAGNAQVTASAIDVVGGVKTSGNAALHPAPTTGITSISDPLGGLQPPCPTGLTSYGSVKLSGNAQQAICPGIYSQIDVSGNSVLTMNPGIYIIEGGGFTVTGNASVKGSCVMIYNAGSNYPGTGGTFGGITLSGNGTFTLTAATAGPYAGILIFQSRQNTRALSFSGNAMGGMSGVIYAQNALLSMSGNASLANPLDVGMLNLSGNVSLTQTVAGTDGSGDATGLPDTLMAGDLSVYVNDTAGLFSADELARIQDAINDWDALLAAYHVTITEVSDPSLANVVIDTGDTSACGRAADGVLGCYIATTGEIMILQGWNWYAGADASQIGANQYDFESTVTHELGHALGLGHSPDPASPMYATLAAGMADRTVTTHDLNIPDPPGGADPQMAAGFVPRASGPWSVVRAQWATGLAAPSSPTGYPVAVGAAGVPGAVGMMSLVSSSGQWSMDSGEWPAGQVQTHVQAGPGTTLAVHGVDDRGERSLSWTRPDADRVLDAALADLIAGADTSRDAGADGTTRLEVRPADGNVEDGAGTKPIRPDRIDPREFARPVGLPLQSRPVDRGVLRPGLRTVPAADELAAAVEWRLPMDVPDDPGARPAGLHRPGVALAKLGAALIVAGWWGHRDRSRSATSRPSVRPREQ